MRFGQVSSIVLGLLSLVSGAPLEQTVESRQLIPTGLVNLNFTHLNAHFEVSPAEIELLATSHSTLL